MPPLRSKASFIGPMLCLSTSSLPEGNEWQYELKLEGYRALAFKTHGRVGLRSRNNKDFASRYASITEALRKLPDHTVLDMLEGRDIRSEPLETRRELFRRVIKTEPRLSKTVTPEYITPYEGIRSF